MAPNGGFDGTKWAGRHRVALLGFLGFFNVYAMRVNLSVRARTCSPTLVFSTLFPLAPLPPAVMRSPPVPTRHFPLPPAAASCPGNCNLCRSSVFLLFSLTFPHAHPYPPANTLRDRRPPHRDNTIKPTTF